MWPVISVIIEAALALSAFLAFFAGCMLARRAWRGVKGWRGIRR